ncbi:MoaD/ThiS family protein [Sphingomicrobium sp. XHP0239]|uniref:MoaD/ThiS family protein n=1 Tax=Sphingomicrobium maritimum TaxID=3133972 RepID=UPI0031CC9B8A
MDVLFFGRLSGLAAAGPSDAIDSDTFRARLAERHPELADHSVRMVVNKEMLSEPCTLEPGDEIAFLPPMSGG